MRSILIICIICLKSILSAQDKGLKNQIPASTFITDLSDKINISGFVERATTGFTLKAIRDIQYSPNEGLHLGVRIQHKWLGFALSYSPKKLQNDNIGQSELFNVMINSYGKKFGSDLYFLSYRGYFIENTRDLESKAPGSENRKNPFQFRYDLNTVNTGFNVWYLFNSGRYSYRSSFAQNEWQKKSAGSFLINLSVNYYRLNADSTVVPQRYDKSVEEEGRLKSGTFYSFVLMPGYAHTFVLRNFFFITISPSAGLMFQLQDYFTQHDINVKRNGLFPRFMARAAIGYNSGKFYYGITALNDVYTIPLAKNTRIDNQLNSVTIYLGFRFEVPPGLKKASDMLGKWDPVNILSVKSSIK